MSAIKNEIHQRENDKYLLWKENYNYLLGTTDKVVNDLLFLREWSEEGVMDDDTFQMLLPSLEYNAEGLKTTYIHING